MSAKTNKGTDEVKHGPHRPGDHRHQEQQEQQQQQQFGGCQVTLNKWILQQQQQQASL